MLRSAAAAGCDAVFLSTGCADAWSPRVLRAAMGGHFALRIAERQDLSAVAREFHGHCWRPACKPPHPLRVRPARQCGFSDRQRRAGLSDELLNLATHKITIPMPGKVESLNAAAATAICLFEAVRQRA